MNKDASSSETKIATPTVAGNYTSICMVCNRHMEFADKRCRLCTDCVKPAEAPVSSNQYLNERNQTVRMLRALAARERRWLVEDPDEDRRDSLRALEWAAQHLEGLPENWITADETSTRQMTGPGYVLDNIRKLATTDPLIEKQPALERIKAITILCDAILGSSETLLENLIEGNNL